MEQSETIGQSYRMRALLLCLLPLITNAEGIRSVPKSAGWTAKPSAYLIANRVSSKVIGLSQFPVDYKTDLQLEALLVLGDVTGDDKYLRFVEDVMSRRHMPPGHRHPWTREIYTSLPFDILVRSANKAYVRPFVEESMVYRNEAVRSFDGIVSVYIDEFAAEFRAPVVTTPNGASFVRREWTPILVDQVQEYASRMAKTGCLNGDAQFFREAASQFERMSAALQDPRTGLWSHARGFLGSAQSLTEAKWGRGQAWVLRGLVEALTYLPSGSKEADRVGRILRGFAESLITHQDGAGFWHQIVDQPDSYEETSATGLISYYLARAVQQQLLPQQPYRRAAAKAFEALARDKVSTDGHVYGGSKMTPPLPSTADYLGWETALNDGHAVAAVIMAAAGQIALSSASADSAVTSRAKICIESSMQWH